MVKKALCVGINKYPVADMDLNGCVNDATAWAALLIEHFGFDATGVTLLLDEQATKNNILGELDRLLEGATKGDVLVFTNSSHGTYVADSDGDEPRYDEAICPYDMEQNLIVDDELRQRFTTLPDGVRLTVISDSCFSGSVTRGESISEGGDRRRRFVDPRLLGNRVIDGVRHRGRPSRAERYPQRSMREMLVSGCRHDQYSYDDRFDGTYHGAMTYHALQVIRDAEYDVTYTDLWKELVMRLEDAGYDQQPQLEGRSAGKRRRLFT